MLGVVRLLVVPKRSCANLTFRRGARLIVDRDWRDHANAMPADWS